MIHMCNIEQAGFSFNWNASDVRLSLNVSELIWGVNLHVTIENYVELGNNEYYVVVMEDKVYECCVI